MPKKPPTNNHVEQLKCHTRNVCATEGLGGPVESAGAARKAPEIL